MLLSLSLLDGSIACRCLALLQGLQLLVDNVLFVILNQTVVECCYRGRATEVHWFDSRAVPALWQLINFIEAVIISAYDKALAIGRHYIILIAFVGTHYVFRILQHRIG